MRLSFGWRHDKKASPLLGTVPYLPQSPHSCFWQEQIAEALSQLTQMHQTTLAFGKGRSYGDSCLANSGQVLNTQHLDRFIATEWEKVLITAEAGVTLDQILTLTIPQGWVLPVRPSTKYVTLGGAVANDVHGKNLTCGAYLANIYGDLA